jgi:hypothetical protein
LRPDPDEIAAAARDRYVMFLNKDTLVTQGWFGAHVLKRAEAKPAITKSPNTSIGKPCAIMSGSVQPSGRRQEVVS